MNDPDLLREQVRAWIDAHFDPGMSLRSWLELLAEPDTSRDVPFRELKRGTQEQEARPL